MKFLYFTDFHLSDKRPASRKDDYIESLLLKIDEIKKIAKENNCSAILQGGDFLNAPRIDEKVLAMFINRWNDNNSLNDIIMDFKNGNINLEDTVKHLNNSIPMVGIVGNHELFGESMSSYQNTSLSLLEKIGFMKIATKENPVIFKEDDFSVAITGSNYSHETDRDPKKTDYIIDEKQGDFHIHLAHGLVVGTANKIFSNYTLPHEFMDKTKADLTLVGHYHEGLKKTVVDGKILANPGAVVRRNSTSKDMDRKPKVFIITIEKDSKIKIKSVYLKSVKPVEEVFDTTKKEEKKSFTKKLEETKSKIEKANIERGTSISEIVKSIAENQKLEEPIKDEIVSLISEKMKDMKVENSTPPQYIIEKLVLENFQSHKYSVFEFSKGLNVLTGESGSGKTSVIRALSWIYEDNIKNSRRLIRTGCDFCKATIYLSNGFSISRIVEESKSGFNGYEIFNPETGEVSKTNTKELPMIQHLLGFSNLVIDNSRTSKSVPINFLKQGSPWFFVGEGTTGPERAKIIGSIYGTHYADSLSKDLEKEQKKLGITLKDKEKDEKSINLSIKAINYLDEMKDNLQKLELLINKIEENQLKKTEIVNDFKKCANLSKRSKLLKQFLKETEIVENSISKTKSIIQNNTIKMEIMTLSEQLKTAIYRKKQLKIFINDTEPVFKKELNNQRILTMLNEKKTIIENLNNMIKLKKRKAVLLTINKDLEKATACKPLLDNIENKLEQKKEIIELSKKRESLSETVKTLMKIVNDSSSERKKKICEYEQLLEKLGYCPICGNKMSTDNLEKIKHNLLEKQ